MRKKFYDKVLSLLFVGFITLTLFLSVALNWKAIIDNLYENKETLLSFRVSDDYAKEVVSVLNTSYDQAIFLREQYISLYGDMQKSCNKKVFWDSDILKTIVIGTDNKLYSVGNIMSDFGPYYIGRKEMDKYGEAVKELAEYVKEKDAELLVFLAPARYDADKVKLPIEIDDNSRENVEYMYSILKDNENLTVLNSQKLYREQNKDFSELFFRTDHHWTIKTAFWAYTEICKSINENYRYDIDPFFYDINSYTVKTIANSYLGTYGKRVSALFSGYDDFDLIYPNFDTEYVKRICKLTNKSIEESGEIRTKGEYMVAIFNDVLDINDTQFKPTYYNYIALDRSEEIINNHKSATQKKILIIKDSFAVPVSAFLSTCFAETRIIDLRFLKSVSAYEYIDSYNPDLVLILYNPGVYRDECFNFKGNNADEKE